MTKGLVPEGELKEGQFADLINAIIRLKSDLYDTTGKSISDFGRDEAVFMERVLDLVLAGIIETESDEEVEIMLSEVCGVLDPNAVSGFLSSLKEKLEESKDKDSIRAGRPVQNSGITRSKGSPREVVEAKFALARKQLTDPETGAAIASIRRLISGSMDRPTNPCVPDKRRKKKRR
jgi:hypothetical protein